MWGIEYKRADQVISTVIKRMETALLYLAIRQNVIKIAAISRIDIFVEGFHNRTLLVYKFCR